jgi:hypothetical protein
MITAGTFMPLPALPLLGIAPTTIIGVSHLATHATVYFAVLKPGLQTVQAYGSGQNAE